MNDDIHLFCQNFIFLIHFCSFLNRNYISHYFLNIFFIRIYTFSREQNFSQDIQFINLSI